jgi:hypothetical protein
MRHTDETRKRIGEAARRRWADPIYRTDTVAAMKAAGRDISDTRARMPFAKRGEWGAAISQAVKAAWINRKIGVFSQTPNAVRHRKRRLDRGGDLPEKSGILWNDFAIENGIMPQTFRVQMRKYCAHPPYTLVQCQQVYRLVYASSRGKN